MNCGKKQRNLTVLVRPGLAIFVSVLMDWKDHSSWILEVMAQLRPDYFFEKLFSMLRDKRCSIYSIVLMIVRSRRVAELQMYTRSRHRLVEICFQICKVTLEPEKCTFVFPSLPKSALIPQLSQRWSFKARQSSTPAMDPSG